MRKRGYQTTWDIMKQTASPEELKELEAIEKRYEEKPTALNSFGQKLMKQKANPLDKIPGQLLKDHKLYDNPKAEDVKALEKWAQSNEPDNSDPIVANGVITTENALKKQFVDSSKIQKPFKKQKKISREEAKKYADTVVKNTLEQVKSIYQRDAKPAADVSADQLRLQQIEKDLAALNIINGRTPVETEIAEPRPRPTPVEDLPENRGTIFGSDTYYRRKRGL